MKIEINLPPVFEKDYELTGEYRQPKQGEKYLFDRRILTSPFTHGCDYPIVRKKYRIPEFLPDGPIYSTTFKTNGTLFVQFVDSKDGISTFAFMASEAVLIKMGYEMPPSGDVCLRK